MALCLALLLVLFIGLSAFVLVLHCREGIAPILVGKMDLFHEPVVYHGGLELCPAFRTATGVTAWQVASVVGVCKPSHPG